MPNYIYTKPGTPRVIAEIEIESAAGNHMTSPLVTMKMREKTNAAL